MLFSIRSTNNIYRYWRIERKSMIEYIIKQRASEEQRAGGAMSKQTDHLSVTQTV